MERNKVSVLLVSVDALKPEFVFEQERLGINILWRTVHLQAEAYRVCFLLLRIPVIRAS